MFLAEQDLFKGGFQNPFPSTWSSIQSIQWPWSNSPEDAAKKEFARKEQIRGNTVANGVITLSPGQTIRIPVGRKYEFDSHNGEFYYSLLYQGQRVKTGYFKPGTNLYTGNIPVDELEFHQNPRYPYGPVSIIIKTTPAR